MGQSAVHQNKSNLRDLNQNKELGVTLLFRKISDKWPPFLLEHSGIQYIDGIAAKQTALSVRRRLFYG